MPVLPRAKFSKVLDGLGTSIFEQLHLDTPRRRPAYRHVEEHHRVTSRDRLVIVVLFCFDFGGRYIQSQGGPVTYRDA